MNHDNGLMDAEHSVSKSLNFSSSEESTPQKNNNDTQVGPKFSDFEKAKFELDTPIAKKLTIITAGSTAPSDLLHFGPHLHREIDGPFEIAKSEWIQKQPSFVEQPILEEDEELNDVEEFHEAQQVVKTSKKSRRRRLEEEKYRIEEYDKEYAALCEFIIFNW